MLLTSHMKQRSKCLTTCCCVEVYEGALSLLCREACQRELCSPFRVSFFVAPLISVMFLTLSCPPPIDEWKDQNDNKGADLEGPIVFSSVSLWVAAPEAVATLLFSVYFYRSWFFGDSKNISNNNPTYQVTSKSLVAS